MSKYILYRYVEWSLHQPEIDVWNWSGEADFIEFLNIAQEENLLVLLRPGPYICAERDFVHKSYYIYEISFICFNNLFFLGWFSILVINSCT